MGAYIYEKPDVAKLADKEKPAVTESANTITKMVKTTIYGTDLHIIKGNTPEAPQYTTLDHEGIGIVEPVSSGINSLEVDDRVIVSCISSCGKCYYCKKGIYAHYENGGGWILGHLVDGTQAECVKVPSADNPLYRAPTSLPNGTLVMLSDILPAGHEIGVLKEKVKLGGTVAIVDAGPVRLASLLTAQFYLPSEIIMINLDDHRLATAKKFGAIHTVNSSHVNEAIQQIKDINHRDVDVTIETVDIPATFDLCQKLTGVDETIASVGVHGSPIQFGIEKLWIKNINIITGLVSTSTTEELLETLKSKVIQPEQLVTHYSKLSNIENTYNLFRNATDRKVIRLLVENDITE